MIIDISEKIDEVTFGSLIKAYSTLGENETIQIYLNSSGGDPDFGSAMLDAINNKKEITTLIAYGTIYSAAFDLFFKVQCEKRILNGTIGMAHLSRIEFNNFTIEGKPDNQQILVYKKWWEIDKRERLKFYEEVGIDKKDLLKIKKGLNIYFQYNRLLELLNGK